ncbi:MAG: hypothetical protein K6B14_10050 [Lachnospiraceae bacterium]|nr:hypothetical protein [Lachnospiraceae bacterium]
MKIPKYVQRKIETHNALIHRAVKLEQEIDAWYESKVKKYRSIIDDIPDYELSDYKSDLQATFISADNMQHNIDIFCSYAMAIG